MSLVAVMECITLYRRDHVDVANEVESGWGIDTSGGGWRHEVVDLHTLEGLKLNHNALGNWCPYSEPILYLG